MWENWDGLYCVCKQFFLQNSHPTFLYNILKIHFFPLALHDHPCLYLSSLSLCYNSFLGRFNTPAINRQSNEIHLCTYAGSPTNHAFLCFHDYTNWPFPYFLADCLTIVTKWSSFRCTNRKFSHDQYPDQVLFYYYWLT